jgi:hypothetical protein
MVRGHFFPGRADSALARNREIEPEKETRPKEDRMPKRPTSCVYCGGPLPPPALTGRPRSFCSAQCRQANERVVVSRNLHEKERRERERLEAEATARREKLEAEVAARDEREYRRGSRPEGTPQRRRSGKGCSTRRPRRAGGACANGRSQTASPARARTAPPTSTARSTTGSSIGSPSNSVGEGASCDVTPHPYDS